MTKLEGMQLAPAIVTAIVKSELNPPSAKQHNANNRGLILVASIVLAFFTFGISLVVGLLIVWQMEAAEQKAERETRQASLRAYEAGLRSQEDEAEDED